MKSLLRHIQISVNPNIYINNLESIDLGKRILEGEDAIVTFYSNMVFQSISNNGV